jgi:hypothetical protein
MKKLIFRLVLPLTFVSYFIFDKWWYVEIIDGGPDELVYGFPLISCSPSLATSLEWNYYVLETTTNIVVYFLFWFAIVFLINRFIKPVSISNLLERIFYVLLSLCSLAFIYFSIELNSTFYFRRNIDITIMDKGYKWIWQDRPQLDYYKYHPEKLKQIITP